VVLRAAGSALVAGSFFARDDMRNEKIKVVRAFWYAGKQHKVGDVIEVPALFGLELAAANKAERIAAEPAPAASTEIKAEKRDAGRGRQDQGQGLV